MRSVVVYPLLLFGSISIVGAAPPPKTSSPDAKLRAIMHRLEADFLQPLDAGERAALQALLSRLAAHHDPRCTPRDPAAPAG